VFREHSPPPGSTTLFLPRANYCNRPIPGIGRKYWLWKVIAKSAISAIACDRGMIRQVLWPATRGLKISGKPVLLRHGQAWIHPGKTCLEGGCTYPCIRHCWYSSLCSSSHIVDWLNPHLPVFDHVKSSTIWGLFPGIIYPNSSHYIYNIYIHIHIYIYIYIYISHCIPMVPIWGLDPPKKSPSIKIRAVFKKPLSFLLMLLGFFGTPTSRMTIPSILGSIIP